MPHVKGLLMSVTLLALPFVPWTNRPQEAQDADVQAEAEGEEFPWLSERTGFEGEGNTAFHPEIRARHASYNGSGAPWLRLEILDREALFTLPIEEKRTVVKDYLSMLSRRATAMADMCNRGSPGCDDGYDGIELKRVGWIDDKHRQMFGKASATRTVLRDAYWRVDRATKGETITAEGFIASLMHMALVRDLYFGENGCHVPDKIRQTAGAELQEFVDEDE